MGYKFFFGAVLLFCLSVSRPLLGQRLPDPKNLEQVDFYLHTVDVGKRVYDNFGHTAIRVHDRRTGANLIFNWGIFDFGSPVSFSFRFFKGILEYQLGIYSYNASLRQYEYEERTAWEDLLDLKPGEKEILMRRLIWNAQPENRTYNYQYFFDNCSTRPRDYLDEALGGAFKEAYTSISTEQTFRDMVWQHYLSNPEIGFNLDILMNSRIDATMTVWQKMFLPLTLREGLLAMRRPDGSSVVSQSWVLVKFPTPKPTVFHGYEILWLSLGSFLLLGVVLTFSPFTSLQRRMGRRFLGFVAVVYGFYTGLLGVVMVVDWSFSNHLDLHHDANLWLFWPTDFILMAWGARWWWGRKVFSAERTKAIGRYYVIAHFLGLALLSVLWLTGAIEQNVSRVVTYVTPFALLLWVAAYFINHPRLAANDGSP